MLKRNYEIWDLDTEEILISNLTFAEATEQCKAYQEFFGNGIAVAIRESREIKQHITAKQEFKTAWINYFDELQAMGNLN
jgi:hypothetical protein